MKTNYRQFLLTELIRQVLTIPTIALLCVIIVSANAHSAETNVLVLGTTKSYSDVQNNTIPRNQKPFNPKPIVEHLEKILKGDKRLGTVNVVFEDIYRTSDRKLWGKVFPARCYSLQSYNYWPDKQADRWKNLKGDAGTQWDHIVIMGDPSIIANTPGVYARGVKLLLDVIKDSKAKPVLMMQWPHSGSEVPINDFGEVIYRVGDSGGIPVAPAGYAWDELKRKDTGSHPTQKGAFLAAATIYSKIFKRSATESQYSYSAGLADLANKTVKAHEEKEQCSQFS